MQVNDFGYYLLFSVSRGMTSCPICPVFKRKRHKINKSTCPTILVMPFHSIARDHYFIKGLGWVFAVLGNRLCWWRC